MILASIDHSFLQQLLLCCLPYDDFQFPAFLLHYSSGLCWKEELRLLFHLFIYLFVYLLISIGTHGYLFYSMIILHYNRYFFAHIVPDLAIGSCFKLAPESFPHASPSCFISTSFLSDTTRWSYVILCFSCLSTVMSLISKEPCL